MSRKRLAARVPSAKFNTIATLLSHELKFHKISTMDGSGKCDISATENSSNIVIGVIFEIDEHEKSELDKKEGLHFGYEEKGVDLTTPDGQSLKAFTYYATNINESLKPYHWYKEHVLRGAKENGLPEYYVKAIETVESIPDPLPERHEKEMEIYR